MTIPLPMQTSRLILRAFDETDIDVFLTYRSDPDVARYQGWEAPFSREQAASFIQSMQERVPGTPGEWFQVAITLKDSSDLIGDCAFKILGGDPRQAEIGMTLDRKYQGFGYATEAISSLIDYLFVHLDLHRIFANCDPENQSSIRVLERLGFRHEGRMLESLWFKGRYAGEDWYAILQKEWMQLKENRSKV